MITNKFAEKILNAVFKADDVSLGTYYLGLCNDPVVSRDMELSDVHEITGAGYERIAITRDASGWVAQSIQPNVLKLASKTVIFSATAEWTPFNRLFIASTPNNTGDVLAFSAATSPVTLTSGQTYPCTFDFYI